MNDEKQFILLCNTIDIVDIHGASWNDTDNKMVAWPTQQHEDALS